VIPSGLTRMKKMLSSFAAVVDEARYSQGAGGFEACVEAETVALIDSPASLIEMCGTETRGSRRKNENTGMAT
jgi:hypothetical protein